MVEPHDESSPEHRTGTAAGRALVRVRALWLMSRPEQVLLVLVVFTVGVASALADTGDRQTPSAAAVVWSTLALTLAAVSIHVINEWADHDTDALTRRTAFSGGSGALARYALPRSFAAEAALASFAAAVAAGVVAAASGGGSLVLLLAGLVGGWAYSVPPARLSRRGLGEITNAALGGLVLPVYGVSVVREPTGTDALAFLPFALLAFVNLLETQWPDRDADRAVGKLTLVSRLTARGVRRLGWLVVLAAYAGALLLTPQVLPLAVTAASFLAAPLSVWGAVTLTQRTAPLPAVLAMIVAIVAQGLAWLALIP
jgi:1,4-dihydroxy-2-naphthoate octaprenyltransferase